MFVNKNSRRRIIIRPGIFVRLPYDGMDSLQTIHTAAGRIVT